MGRLRYGTSSWSEKAWAGTFYPAGMPAGAWLGSYAERFDTVEADNTYYRVPAPALVRGWRDRTPEGFVLAAKFPRSVVHAGDGPRPDAEVVLDRSRGTSATAWRFATGPGSAPRCWISCGATGWLSSWWTSTTCPIRPTSGTPPTCSPRTSPTRD